MLIAATVDTNALASGFVRANPAAPPAQVLDAWRARRFRLVLSEHILAELERTFSRPYFRQRLSRDEVAADLALLRTRTLITPLSVSVQGVASHPEDDLVLATALSGGVEYLVTGDQDLQALGSYQGVRIVSPRQFLEIIAAIDTDTDPSRSA